MQPYCDFKVQILLRETLPGQLEGLNTCKVCIEL